MPDRKITLEPPEDLLRQAEFAVGIGEVPSVSAYMTDLATPPRESLIDVLDRWDREQGVTSEERAAAEELARQRMATDDARWAALHDGR